MWLTELKWVAIGRLLLVRTLVLIGLLLVLRWVI